MSDETRDTTPSAEALRLLFGDANLADIREQMRASHEGFTRVIANAAGGLCHVGPSPELLRALLAGAAAQGNALEVAGRVLSGVDAGARDLAAAAAAGRRTRAEVARLFGDFRASLAAWRDSEEGRAFRARLAEQRRREESGGVKELDTIA